MTPIAVMSFNRPQYLSRVLESLSVQPEVWGREIFLFQDGAVNKFSGIARAEQRDVEECIKVFRETFPHGVVMNSQDNLGVALNFDRAERFVLESSEVAMFFEDDLVLADTYIRTLDLMIKSHLSDERVGYVSCYGDHYVNLKEQKQNPRRLIAMGHHWAFGLYKRHWLKMREFVKQYLSIVDGVDYRMRDNAAIGRLFNGWGFGNPGSSQDTAKGMATLLCGAVKLNTTPVMGRYIGESGIHMTPKIYERQKYSQTEMFDADVWDLEPLTQEGYAIIRANLMEIAK